MNKFKILLIFSFTFSLQSVAQTWGYIEFYFNAQVQFVVADSEGRKTGTDPRTGTDYDQIPNTSYGYEETDNLDSGSPAIARRGFNTIDKIVDPNFRERYCLEVVGTGRSIYRGRFVLGQTFTSAVVLQEEGVIDSLQSVKYKISYSTDTTVKPTVAKVVDITILRQDFNNCYKLKLLRDDTLYQNFANEVYIIDSLLHIPDAAKTQSELLKLDHFVDLASGGAAQITADGHQILKEDINILLRNLLPGYGR